MNTPSGVAVDDLGDLYVSDGLGRVLFYGTPVRSFTVEASRVLGITVVASGQQPALNDTLLLGPAGVFLIGNQPAVVDAVANRILIYDPPRDWPTESGTNISPPAKSVIGQPDMFTGRAGVGSQRLTAPSAAVYNNNEVFVADSGNNRVIVLPQPYAAATRVLGQLTLDYGAPNLIEGRELFLLDGFATIQGVSGANFSDGAGGNAVAIDTRSDPPRLYVADARNHRVLGWPDARRVKPGDPAVIVIGQPTLLQSIPNYPERQRTDSSLLSPAGVAVDADGNVWVADTGNGRVLRFPKPDFSNPAPLPRANLVLGQANFTDRVSDPPTARNLGAPFGLAFSAEGHLFVVDAGHNRVLLYRKPPSGDFTNTANAVIGQPDLNSSTGGNADNRFISPRGIALDTSGRLYVADTGNNRVPIYASAITPDPDPRPVFTITNSMGTARLRSPHGVTVNPTTGEVWVTDTLASTTGTSVFGRAVRYSEFSFLSVRPSGNLEIRASFPVAVALDPFGNPVLAESSNRLSMYFPAAAGVSAANYLDRPVAPSTYVSLFPRGSERFAFSDTKVFDQVPMPRSLADVQVLINDQPVPLHFVSPGQINFLMPSNAPTTGTVDLLVTRPSTGQIVAAGTLAMNIAAPGLFSASGGGTGQLAALNEDGSVNSPNNPAARGSVIQLFGTGAGVIPGAPADGEPATGLTPTDVKPRVIIGTNFVPDENVQYSGLSPGSIALWQINVKIPDTVVVAPGQTRVVVAILFKDIPSQTPQTQVNISVRN